MLFSQGTKEARNMTDFIRRAVRRLEVGLIFFFSVLGFSFSFFFYFLFAYVAHVVFLLILLYHTRTVCVYMSSSAQPSGVLRKRHIGSTVTLTPVC